MNIRKLLLMVLASAMAALAAYAYPEVNRYAEDITSDMALIYAGGDTRPQWTVDEVMPYVVHTYTDGRKDWFFDAFLLLEFTSGSTGISFQNGGYGKHATKDDWDWLMKSQMKPLASIDSAISLGKKMLGEPRLRHKVVVSIPAAIKAQNRPFGKIDGREMDFSKDEDRLAAEKWAVKRIIELFNAAQFKNIDLAGIYWLEESLFTNGPIMPQVNDWIFRHSLRSYWIPYYKNNEQFRFNWKEYGFDVAYQQPNYFFDRDVPMSQLENACDESKRYGMALEMEFESQGKSRVQHDDPDSYYDRLVDYLDVFEAKGVFAESAVAWYSGTKGFLDLARSTDAKNHEIADRMASIVARRQAAKAASLQWPKNDIRDLALIYQGATWRIDWTEKDFEPYVAHTFADGSREWLFDGFLFLDFGKDGTVKYIPEAGSTGADKDDWQWYLDRVFEKGKSLDALDKYISRLKKELGDPGFRHKIVLTLVVPEYGKTDWGELDGVALDFNDDNDRVAAAKWYIDQMLERFNSAGYANLDLQGIYWLDEDLIHTHSFPKFIAPYIHEKGLEFVWVPYFKARGYERHREMGFDISYMQPNHFFHNNIPDKRLDETIDVAIRNGMAVEFECDGDALSQNSDSKLDRMVAYIDAFERHGVFDSCPVAYYTGSKLFIEMRNNPSPENQAVMDRLARIIVNRRNNPQLAQPAPAVLKVSGGKLSYNATTPWNDSIGIDFEPCMANKLFTFSEVRLNGEVVNKTDSDNIGPFGLAGKGWSGGNHLNDGIRSARTVRVEAKADGKPIALGSDAVVECRLLEIDVENALFMPADTLPFATETISYTVAGNSVDVRAKHEYVCARPALIDRYYGLQSMFVGETEILTPGGMYRCWTPAARVDRFTKASASPFFDTFVEHSPNAYQAVWVDTSVGLGDRALLDDHDVLFIGNSYGKSYHKLIGSRTVKAGDATEWHGVYSWFSRPLLDTCRNNANGGNFAYRGTVAGVPHLFLTDDAGKTIVKQLKY